MKFLKKKKYSILLNIFKYSFVGVLGSALILPALFINDFTKIKIVSASGPVITTSNLTNLTVTLNASGLTPNTNVVIQIDDYGNQTPHYFKSELLKSNASGLASFSFTGLSPGGEYRGGVGYTGTSNLVADVIFTTNTTANPSMTVSNITDTTAKLNGINFPKGNYKIYFERAIGISGGYIEASTLDINGNFYNYTITALLPCNSYTIIAHKDSLVGNILASVSFETPGDNCSSNLPKITSINPTSGKVGDMVTINGENLIVLKKILFNTTQATTNTNSATEITAKVPPGATNGIITVITNDGSISSSNNFTVLANDAVVTPPNPPTDEGTQESVYEYNGVKFKGLVPICNQGEIDPKTGNYVHPCDFNMVMALVNRFINFLLITLATPLFALIIIYTGWLYLSDMGSAENITKAKKIFKNVLIGYVIALAAWLIVKTILVGVGFDPRAAFLSF